MEKRIFRRGLVAVVVMLLALAGMGWIAGPSGWLTAEARAEGGHEVRAATAELARRMVRLRTEVDGLDGCRGAACATKAAALDAVTAELEAELARLSQAVEAVER